MTLSFAAGAKAEICRNIPQKHCCALAECFGVLLFCNTFSAQNIRIITESRDFALNLPKLFKRAFNLEFDLLPNQETAGKLNFQFTDPQKIHTIMDAFGFDTRDTLSVHINLPVVEEDCCKAAFLRGAFLSGGSISDPNKEYHLEIVSKNDDSSWKLCSTLQKIGLDAKTTQRGNMYVVYIKDSESIEDFLTMIGATKAVLMYMNTKIYKDLRNQINRTSNCVAANMRKVGQSSGKYVDAINRIEKAGMLDALPDDLKDIAIARRDNFEMPLSELGAMFSLSRSGIHHRLKRILEFAEKLDQG